MPGALLNYSVAKPHEEAGIDGEFVVFSLLVRKDGFNERRRKDVGNQKQPWVRKEGWPQFFLWVFSVGPWTLSAGRLLHRAFMRVRGKDSL